MGKKERAKRFAEVKRMLNPKDGTREVFFDFNGMPRSVLVADRSAQSDRSVPCELDAD